MRVPQCILLVGRGAGCLPFPIPFPIARTDHVHDDDGDDGVSDVLSTACDDDQRLVIRDLNTASSAAATAADGGGLTASAL